MSNSKNSSGSSGSTETTEEQFDWSEELAQGTTKSIVQWNNGGKEPPLIIIHGAGGTIHAYLHFEQEFKTNIWAIQITPETPKNSLYDQARFYFHKVKEQQPEGPYRLAAYSGTSMLVIPLAQMLQESGGTIIQLAFIDHFPTLLFCPGIGVHIKGNQPVDVGPATRRAFLATSFRSVCRMIRNDGDGNVARRHKLADDLMGAFNGNPNSEFIATFYKTMDELLNCVFDFIVSLVDTHGPTGVLDSLVGWIESVKAPITLYVAAQGTVGDVMPEHLNQWADLGAHFCPSKPRVVYLDANHFDVLSDKRLIHDLQRDYLPAGAKL